MRDQSKTTRMDINERRREGIYKSYVGVRFSNGAVFVQVLTGEQAQELEFRLNLKNHSYDGFNWGYSGSGPAQLALAILADYFGDDQAALKYYQAFKNKVITGFKEDTFCLLEKEIDTAIFQIIEDEKWPILTYCPQCLTEYGCICPGFLALKEQARKSHEQEN